MYALDIETRGLDCGENPYALEPYRVKTQQAEITAIGIHGENESFQFNHTEDNFTYDVREALDSLKKSKQEVYCHNGVFDVSFLIAQFGIDAVRDIKWRDSMLLNKWLINGQKADRLKVSYSLANCCKRALRDHPKMEEFLDVKGQQVKPEEDFDYWLERNRLDAEMTYDLVNKLLPHLKKRDNYRGYIVTCNCIMPIAEGYVQGIDVDYTSVLEYKNSLAKRQKEIEQELGFPGITFTSSKRLANLLFEEWKMEPVGYTPKGAPSTAADNMKRLQQREKDPRLDLIMEYKLCATMMSKYVKGFGRSFQYLNQHKIHGQPRILSTVTGRMTYTTKFFKKDGFQTSIAMHQLPRKDKSVKRCMRPPKGYKVLYMDFGAQEGRVMAITAPEPTMIKSYNEGIDLHSDLTEEIFGTPYETIVKANESGKPEDIVEQRQAGKLTGLSSFYRIGAKALAGKFFSTYDYDISIPTAQSYLTSFKRKYPGVPEYWRKAIGSAKDKGYAEAFGGWRYSLESFDWKGESSAINHPIQGGGSMLTYAAIAVISKAYPQLIMVSQVHDSLAYFIPEETVKDLPTMKADINEIPYGNLLGFKQTVPLIFDMGVGDNFADLEYV